MIEMWTYLNQEWRDLDLKLAFGAEKNWFWNSFNVHFYWAPLVYEERGKQTNKDSAWGLFTSLNPLYWAYYKQAKLYRIVLQTRQNKRNNVKWYEIINSLKAKVLTQFLNDSESTSLLFYFNKGPKSSSFSVKDEP